MATMIAPSEHAAVQTLEQPAAAVRRAPAWWWGAYLTAIVVAEMITASRSVEIGVAAHLILLITLPIHAMFAAPAARPLLIALILAPLIRIVSLAMPTAGLSPANQYLLTSLPVVAAVLASMRVIGLSRREIGLRFQQWPLQLAIGLLGLPIGGLLFAIMRPAPIIPELNWQSALLPVLVFLVLVGFVEETIFRGILQTLGQRTLGEWGLVYVSGVFAALHIGYLSPPHAGLMFMVGLVFGWLAARTRSIVGVAVAHGLTNIVLYLIFPLVLVQGGWSLPDVSWSGYARSAGPASAPASSAAETSAQVESETTAVGPTPVSRQAPAAPGAAPTGAAVPTIQPTAGLPALAPSSAPAVIASPAVPPTATPAPSPSPAAKTPAAVLPPVAPRPERVVVAVDGEARVRAEPSTDAPILMTAPRGAVLEIAGPDREVEGRTWRNVQLSDGQIGWIDATLIDPPDVDAGAAETGTTLIVAASEAGASTTGTTAASIAPSPVPAVAAALAAAAVAGPDGPVQTVVRLYRALDEADYDTLVALWSPRMRDTVKLDANQLRARPPSQELVLERADLVSVDDAAGRAVVDVEVLETVDARIGVKRRYVGSWHLVRGEAGWLVDEPSIRIE